MAEQRGEMPRERNVSKGLRARLEQWGQTWWRERGGPAGVRDAFLSNIDVIGQAFEPGKAQEVFGKVRKFLVWKAHAAGYAAMVSDITAAALSARYFIKRGNRAAESARRNILAGFDETLRRPDMQQRMGQYREQVAPNQPSKATVIDNTSQKILEKDPGYRRTMADVMQDAARSRGEDLSRLTSGVLRTAHGLTGAYATGIILERGPVHKAAKFGAKFERASGIVVARIVNRIVRGWNQSSSASDLSDNQVFEASAKPVQTKYRA